jgi:tryptophanyl-tRNA synthetase
MTNNRMETIVSGIQPTGNLHLGNYLGAIKTWLKLQHQADCFFFLADLHSITVPQDPEKLRECVYLTAATYIACGIDPEKNTIFVQSDVPEHTELGWILSCNTPLGWLNRMTQFKDKAGKDKEKASLGLYGYPVLMAADILLYNPDKVPVGEDQKQHLELTRDIAGAFNRNFNVEIFKQPEPLILGEATRVMSLRDGLKKMSKSDPSDNSRINLTDSADVIADKLKRAKTDSETGITFDAENRPELANLVNIFAALSGQSREQICSDYASAGFAKFKGDLAEIAAIEIGKVSAKINQLLADRAYLESILNQGRESARNVASATLSRVKKAVGLRH